MVLTDMDYPTIFRQMYNESEKVEYYEDKLLPKIAEFKRGKYLEPCYFYDTVTMMGTNNTYLLYWNISDPKQFYQDGYNVKDKYCLHGCMLLAKDKDGSQHAITYKYYKTVVNERLLWMHGLNVYTSHFFSRYRERFDVPKEYSTLDLIGHFAARNLNYTVGLDYNEMVLEKNRMPNGYAGAIYDGVVLGEQSITDIDGRPVFIVKNRTFLGDSNLKMNQSNVIPSKESIVEYSKKIFKAYHGYDLRSD